jgi:hypothetical protein
MIDPTAVPIKRANMTPPPDSMPVAVLVVRPDGSAVYVPLRDYQAGPDTLNPPKEEKRCKPTTKPPRRRRVL